MKTIRKKEVEIVLNNLKERAEYAKKRSDDLAKYDANIYFGEYVAFQEAINLIKCFML